MHALTAHDLWLEPNAPLAARGDELMLHLDSSATASRARRSDPLQKDHVYALRFVLGPRPQRRNLAGGRGRTNRLPAAKVRLESGASLAVMDRLARPITMPPDKFNRYSGRRGAGCGHRATRAARSDRPARARDVQPLPQNAHPGARPDGRHAQHALQTAHGAKTVGNPARNRSRPHGSRARPLVVKVIFEGEPLPGARVFAYHRAASEPPSDALTATTSARGLAEFKVDRPGLWLVRLVHVQPAAARSQSAQPPAWESFWATYVFAVREASSLVATPTPKETEHDADSHH